jgi:hypothetical protein
MDHYAGPATIIKQIGTRSFLIEYKNADGKIRTFQRDVSMLPLVQPKQVDFEPESIEDSSKIPHMYRSLTASPIKEGEIVLLKDGNEAVDWYCAQVIKVLPTHILVQYYTTTTPAPENYAGTSLKERGTGISLKRSFSRHGVFAEVVVMQPQSHLRESGKRATSGQEKLK